MVTFFWIAFDVAISARMMIGGYKFWEIALWFIGGLLLAGLAWYWEDQSDREHKAQLARIENNQTFQSGQISTMTQLMSQDGIKKLAEEWREPITQVAKEAMETLGATIREEPALRAENERLVSENQGLRAFRLHGTPTFSVGIETRTPAQIAQDRQRKALLDRRKELLKAAGHWVDAQQLTPLEVGDSLVFKVTKTDDK
jgi:hypothetical protein